MGSALLEKALLAAAFAQIVLTLGLMVWMGFLRVGAVKQRVVRLKDVALSTERYPEQARKVANAFDNQFQLPVLFLFGVAIAVGAGGVSWGEVLLAWVFVGLRYAHATVHTTNNNLNHRFTVYLFGLIVLAVLLLVIFFRLVFLGAN